ILWEQKVANNRRPIHFVPVYIKIDWFLTRTIFPHDRRERGTVPVVEAVCFARLVGCTLTICDRTGSRIDNEAAQSGQEICSRPSGAHHKPAEVLGPIDADG